MAGFDKHANVQDFMKTLPEASINQLYSSPHTCLTVFRSLPSLSQQYVLRLLFVDAPVFADDIAKWADGKDPSNFVSCLQRLKDTRVFIESPNGTRSIISMNTTFQMQLRSALCEPAVTHNMAKSESNPKDKDKINESATASWEAIVMHLLQPQERFARLDSLFEQMGLKNQGQLSGAGHEYVMQDEYTQVWRFVVAYVRTAPERGLSEHDVLTFLFQLGFHELGKPYPVENLSQSHQVILSDLMSFGLAHRRKTNSRNYYATRLATQLSVGPGSLQSSGFIVLETNFKIYAYTRSQLQLARLSLFCEIQFILPNIIVGCIVRENCMGAMEKGITAEQLISFLETNAHPCMRAANPVIPVAVTTQIRLWEKEVNRLKCTKVVLFEGFSGASEFEKTVAFCTNNDLLVWSNSKHMRLAVPAGQSEPVRQFIRDNKFSA